MKITTITTQQQCKVLRKTPKSGVQSRGNFLASEGKRKYRKSERKENFDQQVKKSKLQRINGLAFYKEKIEDRGHETRCGELGRVSRSCKLSIQETSCDYPVL